MKFLDRLRKLNRLRSRPYKSTHPLIVDSEVENLEYIDETAQISVSRLFGHVRIGRQCQLAHTHVSGRARIGDYSALTGPISIISAEDEVQIGKFCSIAPYVSIHGLNHDFSRPSSYYMASIVFGENYKKDIVSKGQVRIGHDVWIGTQSIVLPGATIGIGAVIGANSVVTGNIPDYAIACGSPAKVARYRFDSDVIEQMLALAWWDWDVDKILQHKDFFLQAVSADTLNTLSQEPMVNGKRAPETSSSVRN